jgi:hypothetical protein
MSWNNISMMQFELPENIVGLGAAELAIFSELCDIFAKHTSSKCRKREILRRQRSVVRGKSWHRITRRHAGA